MATLALAAAGAAAGSALLPAGVSFLGLALTGAQIGAQIGAFAGSFIDNALFGSSGQAATREGPRLKDLQVMASTEGTPIPRLYGRARLGGQVIWADDIEERAVTSSGGGGSGKGIGSSKAQASETIDYQYFASFAVALCEGTISGLGRVWADGQEMDLTNVVYRVYRGNETQGADILIQQKLGATNAPGYRGTAYIVFEKLPLADYGNRLPQLSFEVYRTVEPFGKDVRAVVLIPGSGEFVYATEGVSNELQPGESESENMNTRLGAVDWTVSLDQMEATLPNAKSVSLVVSWFGTDLRASHCDLRPGVERLNKLTTPLTWSVAGVNRSAAYVVSTVDDRPAYGGTPSDETVVQAIVDLKARGMSVVLNPFILMDVPSSNALPDPYGGTSQAAYPWRGRITVHPAPGEPGSPDGTATAASQIAAFMGTADPSGFAISGTDVIYSGPSEWSYRRMILHYANLAKAAGGVSAFMIGSEMRGLTHARSAAGVYPMVQALVALAADVKDILGSTTTVLYSADWSEYFGHQPSDGSGDVYFHLDPLWSSPDIGAIGIDVYWPLADWRDGGSHLDIEAGYRSIYDLAYLKSNVQGGEGYEWYYASQAHRDNQTRTPITDGEGKPWVFRYKDLKSWWLNQHYNRPGGLEQSTPTGWVPQSKPFWFMEIGCPAVDKGANQPNVFIDPKSSESFAPYYSRVTRDDLMQRRFLRAMIEAFDPSKSGYIAGSNPVSTLTGKRMVDISRTHVYAWDARPFPTFPFNTELWSDGDNWRLGHWLNGRFAVAPLAETVSQIMLDYGFSSINSKALVGMIPGYVIDRIMAPRDALQPLELAYFFDSRETGGEIEFIHRGGEAPKASLTEDDLVEDKPGIALLSLTRAQETELPASAKIRFIGGSGDYRQSIAEARRLTGASGRVSQAELPMVLEFEQAGEMAETWLFESWAARERVAFSLPPSLIAIEPGDVLSIERRAETHLVRVTDVGEHGARAIQGLSIDPDIYGGAIAPSREVSVVSPVITGTPLVELLDLPLLRGDEAPERGYVAAYKQPWPGAIALYGSPETTGYKLRALIGASAVIGKTQTALPSNKPSILDHTTVLRVVLKTGSLSSVSTAQLLAGSNAAALKTPDGRWEVIQFQTATLVANLTYDLSGLIRGQSGTEDVIQATLAHGATFVLLGDELVAFSVPANETGLTYHWRYGPASRDIGDKTYGETTLAFRGRALSPLAPAHVRGERSSGDLTISWVRRTRIGGDTWDRTEVPLGEASERYEVDILSGAVVKRTLSSTTPQVAYSAIQQTADFGALQSSVSLCVYQVSDTIGRGIARAATV